MLDLDFIALHTPKTRPPYHWRQREKHLILADLSLLKQRKQPASAVSAQTGCSLYFSCRKQLKTVRADRMNDAGKPRPAAVCPLVTPAHGSPSDGFIYDGAR